MMLVSQPKSRRDGEPKIKFVKNKTEFGVATKVYYGKLQKNQNDKTRSTKKTRFWIRESITCGEGFSTPHRPFYDGTFN